MLIITWQPEPKPTSCTATLESHFEPRWTHSFPDCSLPCIQIFFFFQAGYVKQMVSARRLFRVCWWVGMPTHTVRASTDRNLHIHVFVGIPVYISMDCVWVCLCLFYCICLCVCVLEYVCVFGHMPPPHTRICHRHTPPVGISCKGKPSWKHWAFG